MPASRKSKLPHRLLRASLLAWLAIALCAVVARDVYRWVDAQGIVHYTDQPPTGTAASRTPVSVVRVEGEVAKIAGLRVDADGSRYAAVASNMIAGPVEVELRASDASNLASQPLLPMHTLLPAYASSRIATLWLADPTRPGGFKLQLGAVPGDPGAQPRDYAYRLPVETSQWRIVQGWHGQFTHNDAQSGYAIDIAVDEGTPVLAARDGTVVMVESDFDKAGLDMARYADRANEIRILHDDGTMAVYAHLRLDGALVRPGQHVVAGQRIGYSGNTGYTTGPHLHFCVQVNRGMDLESIPFRMVGPSGAVAIPGAP